MKVDWLIVRAEYSVYVLVQGIAKELVQRVLSGIWYFRKRERTFSDVI
ncbi:hypothetical protein [Scytonema sp. PCC 10023]